MLERMRLRPILDIILCDVLGISVCVYIMVLCTILRQLSALVVFSYVNLEGLIKF